jgi:hypothetical protein
MGRAFRGGAAMTALRGLPAILLASGALGATLGCQEAPRSPTTTSAATSPASVAQVAYFIYLTNPDDVVAHQRTHPTGVRGHSPASAASVFRVPLGGQTPDRNWTPPGILIPPGGADFNPRVPSGTIPTTPWSDPVAYEWVGYFTY